MRKWKITYVGDDYHLKISYIEALDVFTAITYAVTSIKPSRIVSIVEELEL